MAMAATACTSAGLGTVTSHNVFLPTCGDGEIVDLNASVTAETSPRAM